MISLYNGERKHGVGDVGKRSVRRKERYACNEKTYSAHFRASTLFHLAFSVSRLTSSLDGLFYSFFRGLATAPELKEKRPPMVSENRQNPSARQATLKSDLSGYVARRAKDRENLIKQPPKRGQFAGATHLVIHEAKEGSISQSSIGPFSRKPLKLNSVPRRIYVVVLCGLRQTQMRKLRGALQCAHERIKRLSNLSIPLTYGLSI